MTAPNRGGRPRTLVQCVNTGQVFPSIAAAAAWAFVDRRRIREALQHGSAAGGYHWAAPGAAAPAEPAMPPAEGDVERLVAWLEQQPGGLGRRAACARVAELLRQQAAELERLRWVPVPVSERLPDESDPSECRMPDSDCWWFDPHADGAWYMDTYQSCYTHWLPFNALPLPLAEDEA